MNDLEARIRAYTRHIDDSAPSAEQLLPPGLKQQMGMPSTTIEVRIDHTPARPPAPGTWRVVATITAVVAAIVIAIAVPSLLFLTGDRQDPVVTGPEIPGPVAAPQATAAPLLELDMSTQILVGTGWEPESTITVTTPSLDQRWSGTTRSDRGGGFEIAVEIEPCCENDAVLVVTDGRSTVAGAADWRGRVMRFDPDADVVAGGWHTQSDGTLVLTVRSGGTAVHTTDVEIVDGIWHVDLSPDVDLTDSMTVETTIERDGIRYTYQSPPLVAVDFGVILPNTVVGSGWLPGDLLELSIDGEFVGTVAADRGGYLDGHPRVEFAVGSVIRLSDERSERSVQIRPVTFDVIDGASGVATGTAPDGLVLDVTVLIGPPGGEPTRRADDRLTASEGEWRLDFEPVAGGDVVLHAYAIYRSLDGTVEVQPLQFQN